MTLNFFYNHYEIWVLTNIGFNLPGLLIKLKVILSGVFPNIGWLILFTNLDFIFSIACFVCLYPNIELASFLKLNKEEKEKAYITIVSISVNKTAGSLCK